MQPLPVLQVTAARWKSFGPVLLRVFSFFKLRRTRMQTSNKIYKNARNKKKRMQTRRLSSLHNHSHLVPSVFNTALCNKVAVTRDRIIHPLYKPCFKIDITSLHIKNTGYKKISGHNPRAGARPSSLPRIMTFKESKLTLVFSNIFKYVKDCTVNFITSWSVLTVNKRHCSF